MLVDQYQQVRVVVLNGRMAEVSIKTIRGTFQGRTVTYYWYTGGELHA
jgi:hypothetical protein